ncbi:uncharacterized protein [Panulirus ornatus]|uniref:uncharacterized protein n=1 Tax=Panulirus ornatus TaxID=150431 RepID=UPI003A88045F
MLTLSVSPPKPWSHIWFNATGPPSVSRCTRIEYLDWQGRDSSRQKTFLLTCRIPSSEAHLSPKAVSIVSKPCQRTSNLLELRRHILNPLASRCMAGRDDDALGTSGVNVATEGIMGSEATRGSGGDGAQHNDGLRGRKTSCRGRQQRGSGINPQNKFAGLRQNTSLRWISNPHFPFPPPSPSYDSNSTAVWATAVCGPALYYYNDDFSVRLVEWLELLRAQGFSQVFLLETDVHPNIQKVLRYYEAHGFLGITKFSYPYPYINEPSLRRLWKLSDRQRMWAMENAYFTECLLRHMHLYRFIAHIDPDEIPMMAKHTSFPVLLTERINRVARVRHPAAYKLRWFFHYDDLPSNGTLPEYVWALRHTRRTKSPAPPMPGFSKSVYDMDVATGVFSHEVLICQRGGCAGSHTSIPYKLAYLAHYSKKCGKQCKNPDSTKEDLSLHKYKDQVLPAVTKVLTNLELI